MLLKVNLSINVLTVIFVRNLLKATMPSVSDFQKGVMMNSQVSYKKNDKVEAENDPENAIGCILIKGIWLALLPRIF